MTPTEQWYYIRCALNSAAPSGPLPSSIIGFPDSAFVFEGDSITEQSGIPVQDRWTTMLMADQRFSGVVANYNVATPANVLANIVAQYPTEVYPHRPSAEGTSKTYLTVWIGTNDIFFGNIPNVATYMTSLEAYWQTAIDDGFTVIALTALVRSEFTATQELLRRELNEAIRNSEFFRNNIGDVYLYDVAALLPDWDSVYFMDGVHPSADGNARISQGLANSMFIEALNEPLNSALGYLPYSETVDGNPYFLGAKIFPYFSGGGYFSNPTSPISPTNGVGLFSAAGEFDAFEFSGELWFYGRPTGTNTVLAAQADYLALAPSATKMFVARTTGVQQLTGSYQVAVNSTAATQALALGSAYLQVYTGAGGDTFTLPAVAGNAGLSFVIKNRGSGALSVASNAGSQIYDTSAQAAINVAAGASVTVINDGTYYLVV